MKKQTLASALLLILLFCNNLLFAAQGCQKRFFTDNGNAMSIYTWSVPDNGDCCKDDVLEPYGGLLEEYVKNEGNTYSLVSSTYISPSAAQQVGCP